MVINYKCWKRYGILRTLQAYSRVYNKYKILQDKNRQKSQEGKTIYQNHFQFLFRLASETVTEEVIYYGSSQRYDFSYLIEEFRILW
jgi:hypothetical protein